MLAVSMPERRAAHLSAIARFGVGLLGLWLCTAMLPTAYADDESERIEQLLEGASEDERALLDQARAALIAADEPERTDEARERALSIAREAVALVEARRALLEARRLHEAARTRRSAAEERHRAALARRDAATRDLHHREGEVAPPPRGTE